MGKVRQTGWPIVYLGLVLFLGMFGLLVYAVFHDLYYVDFSSLYMAMSAVWQDENPYRVLTTDYLPVAKKLPVNLNPPFTLLLFSPLHFISYHHALFLYFFAAIIMGLVAADRCGYYFLERRFWQSNRWLLLILYSTLFSTIAGISIAQLGAPLFLALMGGYGFYRQNKEVTAAFCFALAIAAKLFPAVLVFFFLQQKRYRLLAFTCGWTALFFYLPLLFFRQDVYELYFSMMHRVMWYGDSWNGSFYGIVMRYFVDTNITNIEMWPYQLLWLVIAGAVLVTYTFSHRFFLEPKRSFAMALVLMILLSPFGWLYYFSLLLPALALTFHDAEHKGIKALILWFVALVLVNFPIDYVMDSIMKNMLYKLTFYSVFSYGVLLLTYLMMQAPCREPQSQYGREVLFWPVYYNQLFAIIIFINIILTRF